MTIENGTFTQNTSGDDGGGLEMDECPGGSVVGCIFDRNTAVDDGGGLRVDETVNVTITSCTFTDNVSGAEGGGIQRLADNLRDALEQNQ